MDLHQLVSSTTTAFVERLRQRRADSARAHLQALREALETAAREVETASCDDGESAALQALLTEGLERELARIRGESEAALAALRDQLSAERAAGTELAATLTEAERRLATFDDALGAARRDAEEARGLADALQAELATLEQTRRAATERAEAQLADAERECARLTATLQAAQDCAEAARREAAETAAAAVSREADLLTELEAAQATLVAVRGEADRLAADLQAERDRMEAAATSHAQALAAAAARDDEQRAAIAGLESALRESREHAAGLSADLHAIATRADAAERDLALTVDAHASLEAELRQTRAEAEQAAHEREAAARELSQARRALEARELDADRLRQEVEHAAGRAADLEQRLEEARGSSRDRDALAAELELRSARAAELEASIAMHEAHVRQLEARIQEAAQTEALLVEDFAARELAFGAEREEAGRTREALVAVRRDHEHALTRVSALEADLADATTVARVERDALTAQLETALSRTHALEGELAEAREVHATLQKRLDEAAHVEAALRVKLVGAGAGYDATAARVRSLERELATAVQSARTERDTLTAQLGSATARADALDTDLAAERAARAQLESRLGEAASIEAGLRLELAGRNAAQENDHTAVETLREEIHRLAALLDLSARGATELAAVQNAAVLLSGLVKRLAIQFTRVALFRVKGDCLELEQQIGLDDARASAARAVPIAAETLLGQAARTADAQSLSGVDVQARTGLPFEGAPSLAVALPLVLNGTPIAVVYADDGGDPRAAAGAATLDASAVAFAQLLTGQAVALLVRHTHELKTLAELRQYATTLLQESREMYAADLESGKSGEALLNRLRENIDCASQLYAYRAAMEGTAAAALFDEQLAEEAAADTPFARDLGRLLAAAEAAESLIANP